MITLITEYILVMIKKKYIAQRSKSKFTQAAVLKFPGTMLSNLSFTMQREKTLCANHLHCLFFVSFRSLHCRRISTKLRNGCLRDINICSLLTLILYMLHCITIYCLN